MKTCVILLMLLGSGCISALDSAEPVPKEPLYISSDAFLGPVAGQSETEILRAMVFARGSWSLPWNGRTLFVVASSPPAGSSTVTDVVVFMKSSGSSGYSRRCFIELMGVQVGKVHLSKDGHLEVFSGENRLLFQCDARAL